MCIDLELMTAGDAGKPPGPEMSVSSYKRVKDLHHCLRKFCIQDAGV